MSSNNNFINNLQSKSESTKNVVAATLAIIPVFLLGYAQFYMNAKSSEDKIASNSDSAVVADVQDISAIDSIQKIFSEGKASVGSAIGQLNQLDKKMLEKPEVNNANVLIETTPVASGTTSTIEVSNFTKTTE